jgi:phycobilisome core-membrane linker protein
VVRGSWTAAISGGEKLASPEALRSGPESLRQPPAPSRTWVPARSPSPGFTPSARPATAPVGSPAAPAARLSAPSTAGAWRAAVGTGSFFGAAPAPGGAMEKALRPGLPQGFARRASVGRPVRLLSSPSEGQLREVVETSYRQLLNRAPLAAERLTDAESQLRDGQISVAEFIAQIAGSDLFQQRLNRMAPLRAASAAYISLLGRAAQPAEVSRFLATRAKAGQQAAIEQILGSLEYAEAFGQDSVPCLRGLNSADGIPLATVNRTAALYAGNAGLNPSPREAI